MLKDRLSKSQPLLGLFQGDPNPAFGRMAGECGYDFLILDGEHGDLSDADFAASLKTLATTDVFGVIRLASHDLSALHRYLDMGVDAILVPNVSTVEETQTFLHAMSKHPEAELIVLLESALGVANAETILALEGVSGAFVGPNDLSADLGYRGDYSHPAYAQALAAIERAATATGKLLGTATHGKYSLQALISRGHQLLVIGADRSIMQEGLNAYLAKARSMSDT